jgi:ATP-independent RNA helicase DbpA
VGSIEEINAIASYTREDRQTLLFSATFPNGIKKLSASLQEDAVQVTIDSQHQNTSIKQLFFKTEEDKIDILVRVIAGYNPESCLVFCNSRENCNKVTRSLRGNKMNAQYIHSDLEQKDRTLTLIKFANRSCRILVATDLASRGLDVKDVNMVINYDLPKDPELYVHRIGRTGRAGKEGLAVSLYMDKEQNKIKGIGEYLKKECSIGDVEQFGKFVPRVLASAMTTIYISGGKKNNIRPGDILGALTKDAGLQGIDVGKIDVLDVNSYVAIANEKVYQAVEALSVGKIKGKKFKVGKA